MYKFVAAWFVVFVVYVIYLANTGQQEHFFFRLVNSIPFGDKLGHFCLVGILTLLVNLAIGLKPLFSLPIGLVVLWGTAVTGVFVVCEELSQMFISSRTFDLGDLLSDLAGLAAANWMAIRCSSRRGGWTGQDVA